MARKNVDVRVSIKHLKELYNPLDIVSGKVHITSWEGKKLLAKKIFASVRETWLQYTVVRDSEGNVSHQWQPRVLDHNKVELSGGIYLTPDQTEDFEFEVSMPAQIVPKNSIGTQKNWLVILYVMVKTGMTKMTAPGGAAILPVNFSTVPPIAAYLISKHS